MGRLVSIVNLWDTATTINATAAIASAAVSQKWSLGTCALHVILAGSSPSVDIKFEVSRDQNPDNFVDSYNTAGSTNNTIATTLTASRYIVFSPAMAPFIRIKITGDGSNGANTTARAYLIFQEEVK